MACCNLSSNSNSCTATPKSGANKEEGLITVGVEEDEEEADENTEEERPLTVTSEARTDAVREGLWLGGGIIDV